MLGERETLTEFVESAVRRAVEYRRIQAEFLARGEAAWQEYRRTGVASPADEVLAKLQAKVDAKRKELSTRRKA